MKSNNKISIFGAGSWGTALALHLSKKFKEVSLWVYENDLYEIIQKERENKWFLSGFKIPKNIVPDNSLASVVNNKSIILIAVPTPALRNIVRKINTYIKPDTLIVNASKGIENEDIHIASLKNQPVRPKRTDFVLSKNFYCVS